MLKWASSSVLKATLLVSVKIISFLSISIDFFMKYKDDSMLQ